MLEFITGRSGTGKTSYCIDRICQEIEKNPMGPAIILLLPEHMTYKIERQIATRLANSGYGFVRCYVYGFKRFAYQVLQETGGGLEPGLTELGRQLLLRKILHDRSNDLVAFARGANKKGFSIELADVLNEFKGYCVTSEALDTASKEVEDVRLKNKLHDLAILYSEYQEALKGKYQDGRDVLSRLVEKLPESKLIKGAQIWLDGFLYFNPLELMLVEGLMRQAEELHVILNMDDMSTAQGLYENTSPTGLFFRSYTTRNRLMAIANRIGISVDPGIHLKTSRRYKSDSLAILEQRLHSRHMEQPEEDCRGINLVETGTYRQEMEAVASEILRLAREKQYHWRDIGILIRDSASYRQLPMVLEDYGIPYFSDQKRQCANHPIAELLRSSLRIGSRWRYDDVFRCIKTGFFSLTAHQIDLLENYCLEFGINSKKRWTQAEPWEYYSRFSIDDDNETAGNDALRRAAEAEACRQQVLLPLQALYAALGEAENVTEMVTAIYEYLELLKVPEKLQQWADEAQNNGRLDQAREHEQVWSNIMELLNQLVELGGTDKITLQELQELLEDGLNNLELALIPPGIDYVNIASFEQNSLDNIRAVFILGANAGVMPAKASENVILSDMERININKIGADKALELTVTSQDKSYGEDYLIYKAFTQAREYLWVSYPLSDSNGSGLEPANIVAVLKGMFKGLSTIYIPQNCANMTEAEQERWLTASGRQAISAMSNVLRETQETGELSELWQSIYAWARSNEIHSKEMDNIINGLRGKTSGCRLPEDLAKKLFTKGGKLQGSVSKFEKYNNCPFQYYVQYGLKLKERPVSSFGTGDLGTLLHGVLREFGQRLQRDNRHWCQVTPQERSEIITAALEKLAPRVNNSLLYSSQMYKHQLQRIAKTADFALERLCAFDEVCQFNPYAFEYSFGGKNKAEDSLEMVYSLGKGCQLELTGQIDRIDVSEDGKYFMIMDYKTGKAAINLLEVYYGLKMQLLTYLLVANEMMKRQSGDGTVLPAAMLYYFVKRPAIKLSSFKESKEGLIKKLENELKMPGWVLMDREVVNQLDGTLNNNFSSQFINIEIKKDGTYKSHSIPNLKSEEDFALLMQYLEVLLKKTGNSILSGNIDIKPVKNMGKKFTPCEYCKYQVICGFDANIEGYEYRQIVKTNDNELMEKIQEELVESAAQGKES